MYREIDRYISSCQQCQTRKKTNNQVRIPAVGMPLASYPFQRIAADYYGPLPITQDGYQYLLVFMDYFSRWAIVEPMKDMTAKSFARAFLDRVVYIYGRPDYILTDQGSNFMAAMTQELHALLGTISLRTTAYRPNTNGLVERFNGTLGTMLSTLCNMRQDDWKEVLAPAVFAYNASTQATLRESPYFILHLRDPTLPGEPFTRYREEHFASTDDFINVMQERHSFAHTFIKEQLGAARDEYLKRNTNITKLHSFAPGELVWMLIPAMALKSNCRKYIHPWIGPYVVVDA